MEGLFILSLLGFTGFSFLSALLAYGYPAGKRGMRQAIPFSVVAIGFLICLVYVGVKANNEPLYEYAVKVHYVDGYSKVLKFEGTERIKPRISSSRGAYYLRFGGDIEYGVIRYEIVNKKLISNP